MRSFTALIIGTLFLASCTNNVAQGNVEFTNAMALINSSVETEAAQGKVMLEHAAELGSPAAAVTLGYYYLTGTHGFAVDTKKALTLFEQAGHAGHKDGQYNAGLAHMRGIGTPIDLKKAYDWFLKAAYQNDAGAQYNTAVMLVNGDGVTADPLTAYAWFTLATENGHDGAEADRDVARRNLTSDDMQGLETVLADIRATIKAATADKVAPITVNANAPL